MAAEQQSISDGSHAISAVVTAVALRLSEIESWRKRRNEDKNLGATESESLNIQTCRNCTWISPDEKTQSDMYVGPVELQRGSVKTTARQKKIEFIGSNEVIVT
jgi:hypothetical protein